VANINRVTITGNLTREPELRSLPSGTAVCELGVAVNHRRKDQSDQWIEEPNYFNVVVFGAQGQNCAQYLSKGRPVAVDGRLRWSSWEDKNGGGKRSKVEIIANVVQFLGSREDNNAGGGGQAQAQGNQGNQGFAATSDVPADTSDFGDPVGAPAGGGNGGGADDDIPF
jgi:single-strand DNA-binding protein